jgi:hypothetical protein
LPASTPPSNASVASAASKAELRDALAATWAALLARPLAEAVPQSALAAALDAALSPASTTDGALPIARALHAALLSELARDETLLGEYVPSPARAALAALATHPDAASRRLLAQVLEHDALEGVIRDVLFDALTEFNGRVNPFFAEWGLPALLKRVMPLGFGAVMKALESVRGEFDKRLEPEMRKFLQLFSRKALRKAADALAAPRDDAPLAAVRRALLEWAYLQPVKTFVTADAEAREHVEAAATAIAEHTAGHAGVRARRAAQVDAFYVRFGGCTMGEVLAAYGVKATPDFDAVAGMWLPAMTAALAAPEVRRFLRSLAAGLPAGEDDGGGR